MRRKTKMGPKRATILKLHGTLSMRQKIGARFKEYRAWAQITQQQLGNLIGLERSNVSDIERAAHLPRHGTLSKFVTLESKMTLAGKK